MSETSDPLHEQLFDVLFFIVLIFVLHYKIKTCFPFKPEFRPCCERFYSFLSCGMIKFEKTVTNKSTLREESLKQPERPLIPGQMTNMVDKV